MQENNIIYTVIGTTKEASGVVTLHLSCGEYDLPKYKAGQFITVFFPETDHKEGKAYSISSSTYEKYMNITIRGVGVFSNKLISKKTGDMILGSLPYGYFYSEAEPSSIVLIAGGIGVTPFRSLIKQSMELHPERKILLLYSNKTNKDVIFKKEFDEMTKRSNGNFSAIYYVTQELPKDNHKEGRIKVEDIMSYSRISNETEFFICGSISFVRDYWRALKASGVKDSNLYTEAFF